MKVIFLEAPYSGEISLPDEVIKQLPKRIGLVASIQFRGQLPAIKKQLEASGMSALIGKGRQQAGQVLGCDSGSASVVQDEVDAFLYIGDGDFHPLGVLNSGKEVFCYNPVQQKIRKLDRSYAERHEKRKLVGIATFYASEHIGIIVTTKSGQQNLKKALVLKEKIEREGKQGYILLQQDIMFSQLENFPFIQMFVNTACPRMTDDYEKFPKPMVNMEYLGEQYAFFRSH